MIPPTRFVFTAAALPAEQARAIITAMICSDSPSTTFERTRERLKRRFETSLVRIIKFAKHETLRKLHRYLYSHRPIMGQDEPPDHPGAIRIAFNPDELKQDLAALLSTDLPATLDIAVSDTLKTLGFRDPWKLPSQDELDFIAQRQNLLSNVSDEIYQEIKNELSAGLNAGEPLRDLAARVTKAFDSITKDRAELIASTETSAAYGFASHRAALAAGIKYKKWLHSVIPKVPRPDHLKIHGLIIPIDEPYPVGDPPLMYPHAPDGAAKDVINCRCISIPVLEADFKAQKNA